MLRPVTLLMSLACVATLVFASPVQAATAGSAGDEAAQAAEPEGWGAFPTGVVQYLSGCGVGILSIPCNLFTCNAWGCLFQPAVVGLVETWVGDSLGQNRAPMIWPIVAAYAVGIVGFGVNLGVGIVIFGLNLSANAAGNNPFSNPFNPASLAQSGISFVVGAVLAAAIPITYAIVSTPKKPGDTGGFPGFMEPANPTGAKDDEVKADTKTETQTETTTPPPADDTPPPVNDTTPPPSDDSIKPFDY